MKGRGCQSYNTWCKINFRKKQSQYTLIIQKFKHVPKCPRKEEKSNAVHHGGGFRFKKKRQQGVPAIPTLHRQRQEEDHKPVAAWCTWEVLGQLGLVPP